MVKGQSNRPFRLGISGDQQEPERQPAERVTAETPGGEEWGPPLPLYPHNMR
jgi:hypothetical protein